MARVRYHRLASKEAAEAVDWYEEQGRGLGAEFLYELQSAEGVVAERPKMCPIWPETRPILNIRRYTLPRFPYALAYLAEDEPVILAVTHVRRRPLYWLDRI